MVGRTSVVLTLETTCYGIARVSSDNCRMSTGILVVFAAPLPPFRLDRGRVIFLYYYCH